jgi:hypothetical protein
MVSSPPVSLAGGLSLFNGLATTVAASSGANVFNKHRHNSVENGKQQQQQANRSKLLEDFR